MKNRRIFLSENKMFRIMELEDNCFSFSELCGDSYCPKTNPDIEPAELAKQKKEFRRLVDSEGVFGYALEKWNPEPDGSWEIVDSCWGFVGQYDPKKELFNHHVVEELKGQIK